MWVEKFEKKCNNCLFQFDQWRVSFRIMRNSRWEKNMPVQGNNACPKCGSRHYTLYGVVDKQIIPEGVMVIGTEVSA